MTAFETTDISPALTAALRADRPLYNAQLAMLRSRQPELDFQAIKAFLRTAVDPIAQVVQVADSERCRFVIQACFQQMLVLSEHRLLGNDVRSMLIKAAWQQVMPKLVSTLTRDPAALLAWVTNAVDRIATTPNSRTESWISGMKSIAPMLDSTEQVRTVGQVLAWQSGLAHYRQGALRSARKLSDRIGSAMFPSKADGWQASVERHLREPWWRGTDEARPKESDGVRVGAFAGWDGAFTAPPKLRAATEGFWVLSGERYFHLIADAFGSVLIASNEAHFTAAIASGAVPDGVGFSDGHLQTGQGRWPVSVPKQDLVLTCNSDTACISSPWSHHIWLYPR